MTHKSKKVYKNVVYKAAKFHESLDRGTNLQSLLLETFHKYNTVGLRRMNIGGQESPIYHVVAKPLSDAEGWTCGALISYTPGTDPMFVIEDESAPEVLLEKLESPVTKDGKKLEILESILFFAVYENHLAVLQTQALKAAQLENYLNWILKSSKVVVQTNTTTLVDTAPKKMRELIANSKGVKTIRLGSSIEVPLTSASKQQESHVSHTAHVSPAAETPAIEKFLRTFISPAQAARIDFAALSDSNISMSVTLTYKNKTTGAGQAVLDSLGAVLRNVDDLETTLDIKGVGTVKGDDLKLGRKISLDSFAGQLSHTEVFKELKKWLTTLVKEEEL